MHTALPFIDEFDVTLDASPDGVFLAAARRLGGTFPGPLGRAFTALLGCAHRGSSFTVPPVEGQEVNGFRVAKVDRPRLLILEGRHRFAAYRLSFMIEPVEGLRSRLRARTDAEFPGITGALYRGLVIRSGAHARIVRAMLSSVARSAVSGR